MNLLFVIAGGGFSADAQTTKVVSGENCDTAVIDHYLKRAKKCIESSDDSVFYYTNEAILKSYRCHFESRIVISLTAMAGWYFGHDLDESIRYGKRALSEFAKSRGSDKTNRHIYTTYNIIGKAYEAKGMIDSCAYYYYLLNDVIEKNEIEDPAAAVSIYSQLALFWININWDINNGNVEPALNFIQKSMLAERTLPASSVQAFTSYMLRGAYYFSLKQYDSSRYYFTLFLKYREAQHTLNATWYAATYLNISETFLEENKPLPAISFIEKTIALKPKLIGNPQYLMIAQLYLSRAYHQQHQYEKSVAAFETAFQYSRPKPFLSREVIEAYKIAGESYTAVHQPDKAIACKNTYIALHDSMMKKDRLDMMNGLQMKYHISEKDKALAEQQLALSESERRSASKNILIISISGIALFLFTLFLFWQRNSRQKQRLQQNELDRFKQQMEIANLNAAMEGVEKERVRIARELHDGIGGLLSAAKMNFELVKHKYALDDNQDYTDSLHLLSEASGELRKTAHNMMPEILLQDGLVEAVGYYCRKVAQNSATDIHFQTAGIVRRLSRDVELAVYRIVQELISNIFKHAHATEALIQMGFSDTIFDLTIEDNGIGIPENILTETKGMGLKSIESRIKNLGGKMSMQNLSGNGTGIYIEIILH